MTDRTHTTMDSPVGPLTLIAADGVLCALYLDRQRHPPAPWLLGAPDPAPFGGYLDQLRGYFAGARTEFDLPLNLVGTPFQLRVWAALRQIPFGTTVSYGELAARIGRPPAAARAVGLANAHNPVSIIVPCHRVVGAAGQLTGYGGGVDRKRYLLDFERRVRARQGAG